MTDDQFNQVMGTVNEYYIKGEKYKSVLNGSFIQMQLYDPSTNRLYNKTAFTDTLYWYDASTNASPVIDFEVVEGQKEILGYKCDVLTLNTESGKEVYYYNPELKVDPRDYENHNFGNWSFIMSKTKSLPLRVEIDNQQFTSVFEVVKVESIELEDNLFELPDLPTTKSPN